MDPVSRSSHVLDTVRLLPIRWRIFAIAALNSGLAALLLVSVWSAAQVLEKAWAELRQAQQTEHLLGQIDRETERLQGLIHRYNTQPDGKILDRITALRSGLIARLRDETQADLLAADSAAQLTRLIDRVLAGFDGLREMRAGIRQTYDLKVSRPSREMAGLYGVIENLESPSRAALLPPLGKSRDAYHAMLLAANAYYLSTSSSSAAEVSRYAAAIERTVPVMLDLADDDIQRLALGGLKDRAGVFAAGIQDLAGDFAHVTKVLQDDIDGSTEALSATVETLTDRVRAIERSAQARFDGTLYDSARKLTVVALAFLCLVALVGVFVSRSISQPLSELRGGMLAIAGGAYGTIAPGTAASDEIGDMARAVEVFRQNALAKLQADDLLRTAKDSAEKTLSELRVAQASLVESEKLAALGSLVAGVAHEVNNPVGIGLTVASSLTHRCKTLSAEIASGPLRRSHLVDFIAGIEDAAAMIVSNLYRASDLVQSFKQVAVDRSSHGRRRFDLAETCEQVAASLRPGLKSSRIALEIRIPDGIIMDSYPGPLGQVLTNLFLNAVRYAFPADRPGTIAVSAEASDPDRVTITFADDGCGMAEEVRKRAFEPFFTTSRGTGGTGLGLHIAFNIATHQLGGRISLDSALGAGCRFTIAIPTVAPTNQDGVWRPRLS